jgi:hypothetical protein
VPVATQPRGTSAQKPSASPRETKYTLPQHI